MKATSMKVILSVFMLPLSICVSAQQWVNPHFDTHCLDYRDLGYPTQNLIPADNSCITALLAHSNGFIYGATSGKDQSYLFFYNRFINKVRPLGRIAQETGVHHGLVEGSGGEIYIGTGLNMFAPVKLTRDFPVGYEAIEQQLWKDIKDHYNGYPGGHIFRYQPETGDNVRYENDDPCPLEDLGIPVANNTVYALTMNPEKTLIYGISYPDAHFFIFDLKTKTTRDLGEFLTRKVYGGPERTWRSVPRALYCDPATGYVYTSGDNGFLTRYVPGADKLELTWMRLPGEYWEGLKSIDYPVVEGFSLDEASGRLFASTSDGYLVEIELSMEEVIVLGKPRIMRRMRAMAIGRDNKIYMITGEPERSSKLHTYDLSGVEGFRELGVLAVDRSPYYSKRAYQFDAMAVGPDGTVFCGESDRRGALFLYFPLNNKFKGTLNPTNPVVGRQREDTPALIPENL
jgi:hypothetical protein